jgi:pyruvate-formate lyase-activating enzyme
MSDETKKFLTEEELVQLKNYKANKNQITFALGENRLQKESLLSTYRNLVSQEQDFYNKLSIKYGNGNLDLNTGEITPTNE